MSIDPKIHSSWKTVLLKQFNTDSFIGLKAFLQDEKKQFEVYPPSNLIFNAFDACPYNKVKVVILGQDPYHGPGQAHGLSFSVQKGIKLPPSLRNIFKELVDDLGIEMPIEGDLTSWANQGVLLLNATLTVRKSSPGSHQKMGWEAFTDSVIELLSKEKQHLVFLLWGSYARAKRTLIDSDKHLVLEAPHPSPFSAHTGFFGCKHFSAANQYLLTHNEQAIRWSIS